MKIDTDSARAAAVRVRRGEPVAAFWLQGRARLELRDMG